MNRQQIAALYDSFTPEEQDMPRAEFIKQTMDALDPAKMMEETNAIAQGQIQRKQIDAALGRGQR
ncbi:hypothetical protein KAR91_43740 [Candidatus Pacearchaeota archaeon]|nr:hypothetical protein [Candidatus Pacearchaeota archaeon]